MELNKCNCCGKFKSWNELKSQSGDSDDTGSCESWFVCSECCLFEFKNKPEEDK